MKSNIRELRKSMHVSQEELGNALGISQQMVSQMEKNRDRIRIPRLIALADFFHVSTDKILNYEQPKDVREDERLKENDEMLYHLLACVQLHTEGED